MHTLSIMLLTQHRPILTENTFLQNFNYFLKKFKSTVVV